MLADADILLGKLALGREWLTRVDAVGVAREVERSLRGGRRESLAGALIRLGYLTPRQVQELEGVITNGTLVCERCHHRTELARATPQATERCAECASAPLVVEQGVADLAKRTFMQLETPQLDSAPDASERPAAPLSSRVVPLGDNAGGLELSDLELEETPAPGALASAGVDSTVIESSEAATFRSTFLELEVPAKQVSSAPPAARDPVVDPFFGSGDSGLTFDLDDPPEVGQPVANSGSPEVGQPVATAETGNERTMELPPFEGLAPATSAPDGGERTLQLPPLVSAGPTAGGAAPAEETGNERTMELPPFEGLAPGAAASAGDAGMDERTLEMAPFDAQAHAAPGDAEGTLEMDRPLPSAEPSAPAPGWGKRGDTGKLGPTIDLSEATSELAGTAFFNTKEEGAPFAPFTLGEGIEVVAPIARGGMGSVYRGARPNGEVVAVKVLSDRSAAETEHVVRFHRETELAKNLRHPGIVSVQSGGLVERGEHEGRPYIVMEYVAGRDLQAWLDEAPRSPLDCMQILTPVCSAMDYAHGRGVVHRDLKPANVLVRFEDDCPQVCDFGLARFRAGSNLTRTGDILGTPNFMAPEQALGDSKQVGPPTDVYALGAILFHLLVGRPPFVSARTFGVIDKVIKEPAPSPSQFNAEVSSELDAVVLQALAKKPVERFHTCGQLQRALEKLIGA